MNKLLSLLSLCLLLPFATMAQPEGDPKHEYHYRDIEPIETDQYRITFKDQHSQQAFCKMKVTFENKTSDFLIIKTEEITFTFDHGEYHPKEKLLVIEPGEDRSKVIDATSEGKNFHVKELDLKIDGIYLASAKGSPHEAANFALPVTNEKFIAGPFKVQNKSLKKESHITEAAFKVTYTGKDIGIVAPSQIKIKLEDGQEFGNISENVKTEVLLPGKSTKIKTQFKISRKIIDMQFANMEILWNETYTESKMEKIQGQAIHLELDPGKTEAKNK